MEDHIKHPPSLKCPLIEDSSNYAPGEKGQKAHEATGGICISTGVTLSVVVHYGIRGSYFGQFTCYQEGPGR